MMRAIGVRDGGILDAALGRMHDVFLARGNKQLRRVLLNRTIYLFPPGVSITPPMPGMRRRAPAGGCISLVQCRLPQMHQLVKNRPDQLVIGSGDERLQVIRSDDLVLGIAQGR